ncbi:helix-turn-helix domain-containing protein [Streptomyces sp. SID5785]|uniref:helix-turn-helix domain-containing protein n=1 Tax=Streptomyces sp. SID5785 TaxID=2690309 RepID=UPI001361A79B|nr:helix-turn-helix domain-containing protein [Streptomyces sp. SID5785]MZD07263.1 helix-turn-helix domain-containing protein [Streptomyces sp. SID5785]
MASREQHRDGPRERDRALEQRVSELERRLDALEGGSAGPASVPAGTFWALEGLKEQLAEVAGGGVLFTGAVRLPATGARTGPDGGLDGSERSDGAEGSEEPHGREGGRERGRERGREYEWQYGAVTDELLASDWTEVADTFAALGHGLRLRLLREVLSGHTSATELAALDEVGTSGQIYHHLRQLTAAGWLRSAGRGRYEVPAARVVPLLVALTAARPA